MKAILSDAMLKKAKQVLEKEKKTIQKQLAKLEKQDPFLADESVERAKVDEPATDAYEQEGHMRIRANMHESERLLKQINHALAKVSDGSYGVCEICGKPIEEKRLKAFPMAILCLTCEKKREKKTAV